MSDAVKNKLKEIAGIFLDKISSKVVPDDKQNSIWETFDVLFKGGKMDFQEFAIDHFSKQSIDELEKSLTNLIG